MTAKTVETITENIEHVTSTVVVMIIVSWCLLLS